MGRVDQKMTEWWLDVALAQGLVVAPGPQIDLSGSLCTILQELDRHTHCSSVPVSVPISCRNQLGQRFTTLIHEPPPQLGWILDP